MSTREAGGKRYTHSKLTPTLVRGGATLQPASTIDAAYDFIAREAPRSAEGLARLRWVAKQLADPDSPVYGWRKADVKEALDEMQRHGSLAKTQSYIPITVLDLSPWVRHLVKDLMPSFKSKALVLVGRPGWGKTPLLQSIAMAMSRYWIDKGAVDTQLTEACFRTTESLDFLRGEPGVLERPDLYDDGDMNSQSVTALKAFLDVSRTEGMVWARWGATKFAKHQFRAIADNKVMEDAEPGIGERTDGGLGIKPCHFVDMIRPCFPKDASRSDIDALLKRASWVVNTEASIYIRRAGVSSKVERVSNEGPVLTPQGSKIWTSWLRDNEKRDQYELERAQAGELGLMKRIMDNGVATMPSHECDEAGQGPAEADDIANAGGLPTKREIQMPDVKFAFNFRPDGTAPTIDADADEFNVQCRTPPRVKTEPAVAPPAEVVRALFPSPSGASSSTGPRPVQAIEIPDSPPLVKRPRVAPGAQRGIWQGASITERGIAHVAGAFKCGPKAVVTLAGFDGHPNHDILDACYDDVDGPFTLGQLVEKSPDVHFEKAIYRKGFEIDIGTGMSLKSCLRKNASYLLFWEGHAVGLHCADGNVYVADDAFQNVLVANPMAVIREISRHDKVVVMPVVFGDLEPGAHTLDECDATLSVGGVSDASSSLKRPAAFAVISPKKGKARMRSRATRNTCPGSTKVPYVRHGVTSTKVRNDRRKCNRTLASFLTVAEPDLIKNLIEDGILPQLAGATCHHCKEGKLGNLKFHRGRGAHHRCASCKSYVRPHSQHPIFTVGRGEGSEPLAHQAGALFSLVMGGTQALVSTLFGLNHKAVGGLSGRLDEEKAAYVLRHEPNVAFGVIDPWVDVEADEVDLSKSMIPPGDVSDKEKTTQWEQWCGVLQRGVPRSLVLFRLSPALTGDRAPGPGPIRKEEWTTFADQRLANRNIILHTDGARSYRAKVDGMLHDHVVHMKKPVMIEGRRRWLKPFFSKTFVHDLPNGEQVRCRGGSQIIDRFWRKLRAALVGRSGGPSSRTKERRVRACQWDYWHAKEETWAAVGATLTCNRLSVE